MLLLPIFGAITLVAITFLFVASWKLKKSAPTPVKNVAHLVNDDLHPLLLKPAVVLAEMLRKLEVSSIQLTELYIQHLQQVNPHLNAVIKFRFDQAREEARRCDHILCSTPAEQRAALPPFFGVPVTVKECFEFEGFPCTSGLISRKHYYPKRTATCIRRMQDAGCVIMGTTNVSELCMWMEANNGVYGRSRNPFALNRTTGGSSGGEGAIIGAAGSVMGLGSDVGGSIRMPSFFNGIFGHKPSGGSIPNTGQTPIPHNAVNRYCQPGPMCRYSDDLFPFLQVLAGNDHSPESGEHHVEPFWRQMGLTPNHVEMRGLRVYVLEQLPVKLAASVDIELVASLRSAADYLKSIGCDVRPLPTMPALTESFDWWSAMLGDQGIKPFAELMADGSDPVHLGWELVKNTLGASRFTFPAIGLAAFEKLATLPFVIGGLQAAARRGRRFARVFNRFLREGSRVNEEEWGCLIENQTRERKKRKGWCGRKQEEEKDDIRTEVEKELDKSDLGDVDWCPRDAKKLAEGYATGSPREYPQPAVLLVPPHPWPAPPHQIPMLAPFNFVYTGLFNVLELPVTQVPLGLGSQHRVGGAPLGVQVVSAHGFDHLTIRVAMELEKGRVAGWTYPLQH